MMYMTDPAHLSCEPGLTSLRLLANQWVAGAGWINLPIVQYTTAIAVPLCGLMFMQKGSTQLSGVIPDVCCLMPRKLRTHTHTQGVSLREKV